MHSTFKLKAAGSKKWVSQKFLPDEKWKFCLLISGLLETRSKKVFLVKSSITALNLLDWSDILEILEPTLLWKFRIFWPLFLLLLAAELELFDDCWDSFVFEDVSRIWVLVVVGDDQEGRFLEEDDLVALGHLADLLEGVVEELEVRDQDLDDFAPGLIFRSKINFLVDFSLRCTGWRPRYLCRSSRWWCRWAQPLQQPPSSAQKPNKKIKKIEKLIQ